MSHQQRCILAAASVAPAFLTRKSESFEMTRAGPDGILPLEQKLQSNTVPFTPVTLRDGIPSIVTLNSWNTEAENVRNMSTIGNQDKEHFRPFASIIFGGTNDSPQFLRRVCLMLSSLTQSIVTHNISAEIIVVDWASNPSSPSFGNQIAQSCVLYWHVRVVVVPQELHFELQNHYSEMHPNLREAITDVRVFSEAAKNVGARHSRGEFLVFINGDTIISPALLKRLEPSTLRAGYVYRAARWELQVGELHQVDSRLFSGVSAAFKRFESECNMAQSNKFVDLRKECRELCLSDGQCFGFDSRHECLAANTGQNPTHHCPDPVGFEEFCNNGVIPELNDAPQDTILFADASGMLQNDSVAHQHLCVSCFIVQETLWQ